MNRITEQGSVLGVGMLAAVALLYAVASAALPYVSPLSDMLQGF